MLKPNHRRIEAICKTPTSPKPDVSNARNTVKYSSTSRLLNPSVREKSCTRLTKLSKSIATPLGIFLRSRRSSSSLCKEVYPKSSKASFKSSCCRKPVPVKSIVSNLRLYSAISASRRRRAHTRNSRNCIPGSSGAAVPCCRDIAFFAAFSSFFFRMTTKTSLTSPTPKLKVCGANKFINASGMQSTGTSRNFESGTLTAKL
mmetsp:Transcript_13017/g.31011  ORF Transcript_13017/g.31011 Transcript_13017/m.31011 type:complete len:202 (-) Transcript_13017:1500-2105(-)